MCGSGSGCWVRAPPFVRGWIGYGGCTADCKCVWMCIIVWFGKYKIDVLCWIPNIVFHSLVDCLRRTFRHLERTNERAIRTLSVRWMGRWYQFFVIVVFVCCRSIPHPPYPSAPDPSEQSVWYADGPQVDGCYWWRRPKWGRRGESLCNLSSTIII